MNEIKQKTDYDLSRNWYRKTEFLNQLWIGMKTSTLNNYIRQMKDSPYSFGVMGTHGNVFIHADVFRDWFEYKIANQYQVTA